MSVTSLNVVGNSELKTSSAPWLQGAVGCAQNPVIWAPIATGSAIPADVLWVIFFTLL